MRHANPLNVVDGNPPNEKIGVHPSSEFLVEEELLIGAGAR